MLLLRNAHRRLQNAGNCLTCSITGPIICGSFFKFSTRRSINQCECELGSTRCSERKYYWISNKVYSIGKLTLQATYEGKAEKHRVF